MLGYSFAGRHDLLTCALTHRSHSVDNYERLEFLGDSILGFLVAENLYQRFHDTDEGTLTRLRASLVRRETLAKVARNLGLGDFLVLGAGELKSGSHNRDSILSDVLEAVIGAIYLDGGMQAARSFVLDKFSTLLGRADPAAILKDPKTRLQEYLQARARPLPQYTVVAVQGDPPRQRFDVLCQLPDDEQGFAGHGTSRRKAEQSAASAALDCLAASEN
jgi:ribonuclease-3